MGQLWNTLRVWLQGCRKAKAPRRTRLAVEALEDRRLMSVAIIDNLSPDYAAPGWWQADYAQQWADHGRDGGTDWGYPGSTNPATFSFPDLAPGRYRVSATWPHYVDPDFGIHAAAPFRALGNGAVLGTAAFNQRLAPDDFAADGSTWEDLGTFNFSGGTLTVRVLNDGSPDWVVADAVRVERVGDLPGAVHPPHHEDEVPDWVRSRATIRSLTSGPWFSVATWDQGRLPRAGDVVVVSHSVTYNGVSDERLLGVVVDGTLDFSTNLTTRIYVSDFAVSTTGHLRIGSAAQPVAANVRTEIIFPDRPLDLVNDPDQFGSGLVALGRVTVFGASKTPFVRLAVEPLRGHTTLSLAQPTSGWRPGDRLWLPDTRQLTVADRGWVQVGDTYVDRYAQGAQGEYATVAVVSADGRTVTLAAPLAHDHRGARTPEGRLDFLPHVANLARNVIFRSENPDGGQSAGGGWIWNRGHTMFANRADVDIRHAGFEALGRTTNAALHPVQNRIGRYPLHIHHLYGVEGGDSDGYQFRLEGNVVTEADANYPRAKWGVVLHDSHYGLVRGNVSHNWQGSAFTTEDGNESFNTIEGNFASLVRGSFGHGSLLHTSGAGYPGAFWLNTSNNTVRDNVANAVPDTNGIGFMYFLKYIGYVYVPSSPGMAPDTRIDMNATPVREDARNETYGATETGVSIWWIGDNGGPIPGMQESVFRDSVVWHHSGQGIFLYELNATTFDGLVIRGDPTKVFSSDGSGSYGIFGGHYPTTDTLIRNADIQGTRYGYKIADVTFGTQRVEDSYFNNRIDILIQSQELYGMVGFPRRVELRNVRYGGWSEQPLLLRFWTGYADILAPDTVLVYDHNGVAGDNFQVYYHEQAPGFLVPESAYDDFGRIVLRGAPEPGLTQAELFARYGLAIGGEVLPSGTVDGGPWRIGGMVRRL